jgi:hypothetical protein
VPTLLEAGAIVAQRDNAGVTAAMHAQAHRHKQVLLLLKRHTQSERKRAQALATQAENHAAAAAKGGAHGEQEQRDAEGAEARSGAAIGATPADRPRSGTEDPSPAAISASRAAPDSGASQNASLSMPGGVLVRAHAPNGRLRRFGLSGRLLGWWQADDVESPVGAASRPDVVSTAHRAPRRGSR